MLKKYLEDNLLITDGAMGTYYAEITGDYNGFCEFANVNSPEIIKAIHREYINSGAKLIRTNTFSANLKTLKVSEKELRNIIKRGYELAKETAKDQEVFVGASIGPIIDGELEDYIFIIDIFLETEAEIFIFETFNSIDYLEEITSYIKEKKPQSFILTQFAISPDGYSRGGISVNRIISSVRKNKLIDAYGFNCGSGPTHLLKTLKDVNFSEAAISVLPNSGYPEVINGRTLFANNPEYFASKMKSFKELGVKILGGCCGTTPTHIKSLVEIMNKTKNEDQTDMVIEEKAEIKIKRKNNSFIEKLNAGKFVFAVELSPPFDISTEKIMKGAWVCKDNNVDLITVPDSPMAKVRVDSAVIAAKIKREVDIEVMPHLCCRDKNVNAIRSGLLAAHIEGIRNVLAITGDPVLDIDKITAKNVFNLNSFKLMELIFEINNDIFLEEEISLGGALNLNVLNLQVEILRMEKKIKAGASFFLTQPIYEAKAVEALKYIHEKYKVKILAGILPIVSLRNALFLNNELPGVNIPKKFVDRFSMDMSKEESEIVGIDMAVEIAKGIIPFADGIYFMTPFNRVDMIMKIMNKIK